jgi:hypothetical protein
VFQQIAVQAFKSSGRRSLHPVPQVYILEIEIEEIDRKIRDRKMSKQSFVRMGSNGILLM